VVVRPCNTPDTSTTSTTTGRPRLFWRDLLAPVPGVPRWAQLAAYAVPLTVLPSGLWRTLGILSPSFQEHDTAGAYLVFLSLFSLLVAFTSVGLIASWGEVFPRWIPGLRGRRVPTLAAVVPAALGAIALTVVWTAGWVTIPLGITIQGDPTPPDFPTERLTGWPLAGFYATYLPLLLWGPLLGAVTVAYWRRRSAHGHEAKPGH
jgi:hypothetical protein